MGENIVNMGPVNQDKTESKLSYEELEKAAQNLSAQHQNLIARYKELVEKHQELIQNNYFVRLEWLYRVINSDRFPESFIDQCTKEFITMMTPEQEEDNKE